MDGLGIALGAVGGFCLVSAISGSLWWLVPFGVAAGATFGLNPNRRTK